jgi:glyoxylase-like metal-dependent hydrolase (beta-lactamase superfamily II)
MQMVEQILPDIYRIEIPLPKSPLKSLNAYVVKGKERFLVVDTGWNHEACLRSMQSGLKELDVDLNKTDFFITHLHADHIGLAGEIMTKTGKVYLGAVDASVAASDVERTKERVDHMFRTYVSHGFPEEELRRAVANHPGYRYVSQRPLHFSTLREGDRIEIGDYSFTAIETPGHSPGHICLYEPKAKILFSGDHILFDITPNITRWPEMEDSLGQYLTSLDKTYGLDVKLVLPGHRSVMNNHRERIVALRDHHAKRLQEALHAVANGGKTAWEVAPHLSWDIAVRSWEQFPTVQKWFALGETIAHLKHLEVCGNLVSKEHGGRILFSQR